MPMDRSLYPPDWKQISLAKKQSVGWVCESCGKQCRRPGEPFDTHRRTLTVAHLDHNPLNCVPENLMAMCAVCHLRYDAKHHAETRAKHKSNGSAAPTEPLNHTASTFGGGGPEGRKGSS